MPQVEYDVLTFQLDPRREWVSPACDQPRVEALQYLGNKGFVLVTSVEVAGLLTDTFMKVKEEPVSSPVEST
ncbi:hypothetical protein [Sanguibacter inulinus]|uniref:Uncharacterized protein n=1 Tax=Sanguibacter inulinus TaxID=60922 RepID=A0A853ERR9_9MICO|nr:hypothetical protein [Sanguibacter inulinus]MBF0722140.1 hypothetical protein [Sanguibacter inulinus]NYS93285.1 hypothetical protein [Sanguibacter inulinus]